MKDIYLRFSNEKEMREQLIKSGFNEVEGEFFLSGVFIDVVGVIYYHQHNDADNPEYIAQPGWHVNLRIIESDITFDELTPFIVEPKSPSRVWA